MKKRTKVKNPIPYNERERNAKILNLVMQVSEVGMSHTLTPEIKKKMNDFVSKGEPYIDCIDLPRLSRQMIIQLINDKRQQTFINFKYVELERKCCEDNCCEDDCQQETCKEENCHEENCHK